MSDNVVKMDFVKWNKMQPVYFPTWVWQELSKKFPSQYKMFLPIYQGQKVLLT